MYGDERGENIDNHPIRYRKKRILKEKYEKKYVSGIEIYLSYSERIIII